MGFFGGFADGIKPFLLKRHEDAKDKELAEKEQAISFYTKVAQRPDLKPQELGIILKNLGDLASTDPTSKKGKKGQENILHQLGDVMSGMKSEPTPDLSKYEGTQERPRSIKDVPQKKSPFYTSGEMSKKEFEEGRPEREEKQKNALELAQAKADETWENTQARLQLAEQLKEK